MGNSRFVQFRLELKYFKYTKSKRKKKRIDTEALPVSSHTKQSILIVGIKFKVSLRFHQFSHFSQESTNSKRSFAFSVFRPSPGFIGIQSIPPTALHFHTLLVFYNPRPRPRPPPRPPLPRAFEVTNAEPNFE